MDLLEWVRSEIAVIEADERFHYKPALVQINTPLALIRVERKARMWTLKEVERRLNVEASTGE